MFLSIIFLPMLGSIVAGLLGRKVGVTGAQLITTSCLMVSTFLALTAFYEVGLCNSPVQIHLCSWIDSELMDVSWGFMFDSLTVSMLLAVLVVSSLVHVFSIDYMSADPHNQRFFAYLSMFTFFMLILVTGDNYLIMFVGAIEGPTPVSALIHAATLVTAGVYLLLRSSPVIEYGPTTLVLITWVGALTAFFAASTGLLQNDLKRVIAYSTCSQMGYLFMACGLSQYNVALFHLVNHAFFKALLFLAAGAVLHATYDQQDQRKLGGLIGFLPFAYTSILIGSLSLMALPFITGFYSKDLILELCYGQYYFSGQVAYFIGTISASLTAFYSLRLISLTFLTYPNANKSVYLHTHDAPTIVMVPLFILSILAIFFGYIGRDLFVGMSSDFLSESLFIHPNHIHLVEAEFGLPLVIKLMPLIGTILGSSLALYLYHIVPRYTISLTNSKIGRQFYRFFNGKYYIDVIYNHYIIYGGLGLGYILSKVLDRGVIELVGPYGLEKSLTKGSQNIARLDTGNLTNYALYMTISMVVLIFILFSNVLLGITSNFGLVLLLFFVLVLLPNTLLLF